MSDVCLIDYGMGNLASVQRGLERAGASVCVTDDPGVVAEASAVVVPGVGAFGDAMANLRSRGLVEPLKDGIASGKPFLGICLGLQILFEASEEAPGVPGLGVFPGVVRRFGSGVKVPHMGWNQVEIVRPCPVLEGIEMGAYAYFVHSYYPDPEEDECVTTRTEYGLRFVSSVGGNNLFACQFHPEKSQRVGLEILRNFVTMAGVARVACNPCLGCGKTTGNKLPVPPVADC